MHTSRVTPIANLGGTFQEQGRIRLGVKDPKRGMRSIDTFRFTSPDRQVIEQLAEIYGGTARPWSDARASVKNQFEVITKADEIRVWVGSQSISQWNEHWTGGGIERRCDGVTCTFYLKGGKEKIDACVCNGDRPPRPLCRTKTRLTVLLPEVRLAGGWRVETSSEHAANEMPEMLRLIESVQSSGLAAGKLTIVHGMVKKAGETKRFTYPRLILDVSADQLMAGEMVHQLTRSDIEPPALEQGEQVVDLGRDMTPTRDRFGDPIEEADIIEEEGWDDIESAKQSGRPFKKNRGDGPAYLPTD